VEFVADAARRADIPIWAQAGAPQVTKVVDPPFVLRAPRHREAKAGSRAVARGAGRDAGQLIEVIRVDGGIRMPPK
jgi:hypothetical protein